MEGASRRQVHRIGNQAGDRLEFRAPVLNVRQGVEKAPGVGVAQVVEDVGQRAVFHDAPGVHDAHGVAHLGHDSQVMRDHEHGHSGVFLEFVDEPEHLGLDGDVQGRGGLVRDQEVRVAGQCDGYDHALLHSSRELVRVLRYARARDADHLQHGHGLLQGFIVVHPLVDLDAFGDLLADGLDWVERGHGVLEDHGHLVAAHRPQLLEGHFEDVLPLHEYLTGYDPARRRGDQVEDRQGGGGLAGPGFPHQAEGLSGGYGDVQPCNGVHDLLVDDVFHRKVFDFQSVLLGIHRGAPETR